MRLMHFMRPTLLKLSALEKRRSYPIMQFLAQRFGPQSAVNWLFYSPLCYRSASRVSWLYEHLREHYGSAPAERLIIKCLTFRPKLNDYRALLVMADRSAEYLPAVLKALPEITAAANTLQKRVALIRALIECGEAHAAVRVIENSPADHALSRIFDALIPRPLGKQFVEENAGQLPANWNFRPCKHRVLVCSDMLKPGVIAFLANGAEKLTLLIFGELYGHVDLQQIKDLLPNTEIDIEYDRTRTERFQHRYYELHRATEKAAATLTQVFLKANPWVIDAVKDQAGLTRDMTLELSDRFVFRALQLEAVAQVVEDKKFDNVLFILSEQEQLLRLCAAMPHWVRDPRIQACCWMPRARLRSKFGRQMKDLAESVEEEKPFPILTANTDNRVDPIANMPIAIRGYLYLVRSLSWLRRLAHPSRGNASVGMVTHLGRAYGYDAVRMAMRLNARIPTHVIWLSSVTDAFYEHVEKINILQKEAGEATLPPPGLINLVPPFPPRLAVEGVQRITMGFMALPLKEMLSSWRESPVEACTINSFASGELIRHMVNVVARAISTRQLLQRERYKLVALSPMRPPSCAQFASAARSLGIPSMTIEPHLLNASYCRYGTVQTDYAAVYSQYYVDEYAKNFGIPSERCIPFGSPRIMRPRDYDSLAAHKLAREKLGFPADSSLVLVATQPMPAAHILAVWKMILQAAKQLDRPVRILLKAHPEEGQVHLARYRRLIEDEGMADRAAVVDGEIKDFIMASNLVLTPYSVTALEAVVLERNAAIVGQPGIEYPMAYDELIGIPLCNTAQETAKAMAEALDRGPNASSAGQAFRHANPHLFDNSCFDRLQDIVDSAIARGSEGIRSTTELSPSLFVTAPFKEYVV